MNLLEDKIKIIRANIKILERSLEKGENVNLQKLLMREKQELEKFKNSNPEFFI